jgi:hypothetical protein
MSEPELSLEERRSIVLRLLEIEHAIRELSKSGLPKDEQERLSVRLNAEWSRETRRLQPYWADPPAGDQPC